MTWSGLENSTFLEDFADWVEEQQMAGETPKFGDNPDEEEITAQNGMLYQMDPQRPDRPLSDTDLRYL